MNRQAFAGATVAPARVELRVLALIDHLVQGGAELLLSKFAQGAPRAGIQLSVACLTEVWGNPAAVPLRAAGVNPLNLDVRERLGPSALIAVRRHISRLQPDLVHTHLGTSDVLGSLAARSLGVPTVSTLHAPPWGETRRERVKRSLAAGSRRLACARVIAVSDHARSDYLAHTHEDPRRVVTIHNGIDVEAEAGAGAAVRVELGIAQDDIVVGMISALRPVKGHRVAIEAIGLLRQELPRVRLLIVGDGTERRALERQAERGGNGVIFAGSRDDAMRVLDACELCLHPSFAEQFPATVLEAMAASVPVVASAVGGIPEQVQDGVTGILVPAPPEPRALARAMGDLLADRDRRDRLGRAGRMRYEERFTGGPWVAATRALYDEVLSEARGGGGR